MTEKEIAAACSYGFLTVYSAQEALSVGTEEPSQKIK
jgi:hypothetical protein